MSIVIICGAYFSSRGCVIPASWPPVQFSRNLSEINMLFSIKFIVSTNHSFFQVLVALNPRQVEPLLIEIFDLNPKGGGGASGAGTSGGNGMASGNPGEFLNRN